MGQDKRYAIDSNKIRNLGWETKFEKGDTANLSSEAILEIDNAFAKVEVQGDRYPKHLQERVGK